MSGFSWGIIGPGGIANRFAQAVQQSAEMQLLCVLGRDPQRAEAFARRWHVEGKVHPCVAPDLPSMLCDDRIDGIYIATPHSSHAEFIRACLQARKPVLCEKPMVPNVALGLELTRLACQNQVFLMEALWTRFLPIYTTVHRWLSTGAIGRVQSIQSSFCFAASAGPESRLFNPDLAGGALLDIGIYNISMSRWVIHSAHGACPAPSDILVDGVLAGTGVDQRVTGTLRFPGPISAQFVCGLDGEADNSLHIFGSEGAIRLPRNFWEASEAVLSRPGQPPELVQAAFAINGFEYEIDEAVRCIRSGLIESPRMPHSETLATLACMDRIRQLLGVRYPFEAIRSV